ASAHRRYQVGKRDRGAGGQMKRPITVLAALAMTCSLAPIPALRAQYTVPVALVPGFGETSSKFWDLGAQLYGAFYPRVVDLYPALSTRSSIKTQAEELRKFLGSFAPVALTVGHSDGGLVARTMAGLQPGAGPRAIITYGTPNSGVPAVNHINDAWWFYTFLGWDLDGVAFAASDLFFYNHGLGNSALVAIAVAANTALIQAVPALVNDLIYAQSPTQEILNDVKPGAQLLGWLNQNPGSGIADYAVSARVGFRVKTINNMVGGPLRLALSPGAATDFGYAIYFL